MSIVLSIKYPNSSESIEINEGVFTLGRSRTTDIRLKDDKVSGKHIAIELSNNKLTLKDIGSTNGTFLNGNKIDNRVIEFTLNDEIQIGQTYIKIDKSSLNSAELQLLTGRIDQEKTEMKFIEPISAEELSSHEDKKDSKPSEKTQESESPPLTEINFSIDLDEEPHNHTELRAKPSAQDDDETQKVKSLLHREDISTVSEVDNRFSVASQTKEETRTNYVLDAEDIKSADTDTLELEKQKQGRVIQKKIMKKRPQKEEKAKKGFFSKFFK